MTKNQNIREDIERIEEAYEFMLAYAAQGRVDEGAGPDGAHIRNFLNQFLDASQNIMANIDEISAAYKDSDSFINNFENDGNIMISVLVMLLQKDNISSEMIDNANGLITVRSYLTSLFFIDKSLLD